VPTVLDEYDYRFELGKAAELRTGRDVVLISTGLMTMRALQAAARLEADHVDVAVLHVPTIKPLDTEAILAAARTDRLVVTLENHTVVGGLAESVAATLAFAGVGTRLGADCPARGIPRGRRPVDPARPLRAVGRRHRRQGQGQAWWFRAACVAHRPRPGHGAIGRGDRWP
jgi:hypothetical protein